MKKPTKYTVIFILILLFSLFLRFYHFENRVFIFGDSARDVLVARASLQNGLIPPIASFSSAGPFVFAPHYYWLIMAVYRLNINWFDAFYYFLIFQSVLFVLVMMLTGKMILNRRFSLLLGLVAAVSPRLVLRSMGMSQHAIVGVFAALALYFIFKFIKEKNYKFIFLSAMSISLGISMHYEAVALLIMALPIFFVAKKTKNKLIGLLIFIVGLLLPLCSFFWWDKGQNFANIRNFLDYFLIGQYRIYVANRWLWHLFDFWPSTFADLFGGNKIVGGLILYGSFLFLVIAFLRKKLNIYFKYLFIFFLFYFIYLRFYRGEKFEGYLIYLHPFILLVAAYFVYKICTYKKIAFLLLTVFFIINFKVLVPQIQGFPKSELSVYKEIEEKLNKMTSPQTKFVVYDFADQNNQTETWDASDSLSFYLSTRNRIDLKKGTAIGFCKSYCPMVSKEERIVENKFYFDKTKQIFLLQDPKKYHLVRRSAIDVQEEILFWWKTRPLKSTFNLGKFIYERTIGRL